ncbi:MAG: hypothetical protein BWY37_01128 [Firmicutes bacterium ADurb.Bin262]|nr:MAG: hypothetical protein BWY37_01128 [Firmicutes bacterium ADurb.Bin262]
MNPDAAVHDVRQFLFVDEEIDFQREIVRGVGTVDKTEVLRDRLVENHLAQRRLDDFALFGAVDGFGHPDIDARVQLEVALLISHDGLFDVTEHFALAFFAGFVHGQVIRTQNHILRRHGYGAAVGGFEQIVRREHQEARFGLGLRGKGHVDSHLVAVKVRVERGTNQRMKFDGPALDEHGLESLDAQPVKRRRAVEQHRVVLNDNLERVPNFRVGTLDHFSGGFRVAGAFRLDKALHHKGFEQFERHFLGQAALEQFQFRADDDDRTAGIVDALAQKVLPETALFALEHIRKGFQRAVAGTRDRAASSAVVNQGVHRLLEHPLLVADNDFGGAELE